MRTTPKVYRPFPSRSDVSAFSATDACLPEILKNKFSSRRSDISSPLAPCSRYFEICIPCCFPLHVPRISIVAIGLRSAEASNNVPGWKCPNWLRDRNSMGVRWEAWEVGIFRRFRYAASKMWFTHYGSTNDPSLSIMSVGYPRLGALFGWEWTEKGWRKNFWCKSFSTSGGSRSGGC